MRTGKNKLIVSATIIVMIVVAVWSALWYIEQTPINPPNNTTTTQQIPSTNHAKTGTSKVLQDPLHLALRCNVSSI